MTPSYVLKEGDDNVSVARIDGLVLNRGGDAVELMEEQVKRLKDAGAKLEETRGKSSRKQEEV
jgi:hypothetical protein